ncbi:uncharacterized protein LOC141904093 [Tubulanus polymorphus]|uniref:uncharacterized protein LOC141904093 n=1 Tax=Tubulanus polymorphus TaxID=672921 RepID=UPI003DA4C634
MMHCLRTIVLLAMVFGSFWASHAIRPDSREIRYEHFTDYLMELGDELFGEQSTRPRPHSSRATNNQKPRNVSQLVPAPVTSSDIIGYFRDVDRRHWSCCMLGRLAGDKGFHCMAQFYAASIDSRNNNRAQNRRMPRLESIDYGKEIRHQFGRCVKHRPNDFHKCCYAANIERAELARWRRLRRWRN